jgi:hypothetical protein
MGGASGVDLAFETKASAISPRHANPEQVDDASALAESLQDVALVPETAVHTVPDVTMSLLVDQKRRVQTLWGFACGRLGTG